MLQDRQDRNDDNSVPTRNRLVCWAVSEGKAGMEVQVVGLAKALGLDPVVKRVVPRTPWRQFSPFIRMGLKYAYSPRGDAISPPWPDVIITCGRRSHSAGIYARQAAARAGKKCFAICIQDPKVNLGLFDAVVTPRHDGLIGDNVVETIGGLHGLTREGLAAAAESLLPRVAHLPSPRIAFLVGGMNGVYRLTPQELIPLAHAISTAVKAVGGSVLVTPSRRTGEANCAVLNAAFHDVPSYVWNGVGDNPYHGMLGVADAIIVTCDSVNMVTEACYTGKPVMVAHVPGGGTKFNRFHAAMREGGYTRPFVGTIDQWAAPSLDDMGAVVKELKTMMQATLFSGEE